MAMYNNRRGFLRWLALGFGSLVGLLPALAQRRFNRAIAQGAASGPKAAEPEFVKVATLEDLKEGPFKVEDAFGKNTATLWLVGDPQKEESLLALDAACPHAGCDVDWRGENFVCPCHGSVFAADGSRTRGPANADLTAYKVKVEKGEIFVART
jgi:cytochrome b6-f complex iron-sulfur subunit